MAGHTMEEIMNDKDKERRRGLLARMAGNIAAGMILPDARDEDCIRIARVSVEVAIQILDEIDVQEEDLEDDGED